MTRDQFKDKLMAADAQSPMRRDRYEKELAALIEGPLEWYRRAGLIFALLVCAATIVLCVVLAVRFRHGPAILLSGFAVGGAFGLGGVIITARILLRGTYQHRRDSTMQAGLIWIFIALMQTQFMFLDGLHPASNSRFTIFGLVFLVFAAVVLLRTVIEQAELRTREKLLEIQYEMAEIKERLPGPERTSKE